MTTLKELNELATAQDTGATLEAYGALTDAWHEIGKLDELDLDLLGPIRIRQPNIKRDDLVWCGYGVPTKDNCDRYLNIANTFGRVYAGFSPVETGINNGYRHLYRYKQPQVIPYTLETYTEVRNKDRYVIRKGYNELLDLGSAFEADIIIDDSYFFWKVAYEKFTWPDGSPFGVEVK